MTSISEYSQSSNFDDQLIIAARAGDKIAYGRLVKLYQSPVRGFLRQLTRQDYALADDLAQDAFIQGFEKLSSFRDEATFKSWITSIAYRLFLQYIRRNKRRAALLEGAIELEEQKHENTHDDRIDIERAMAKLKVEQRTAITLCHQQGMSHSEVAKVMALPVGTVKSHISRGRETLKVILSQSSVRRSS